MEFQSIVCYRTLKDKEVQMNREMICRVEKWLHLRPALSVPVLCLSLAYYLSEGRMKGVAAKEFVETLQLGEYTFCTDL